MVLSCHCFVLHYSHITVFFYFPRVHGCPKRLEITDDMPPYQIHRKVMVEYYLEKAAHCHIL